MTKYNTYDEVVIDSFGAKIIISTNMELDFNDVEENRYKKSEDAYILNHAAINWDEEYGERMISLEKLVEEVKKIEDELSIITVIAEMGLSGVIYKYGNHGEYWEKTGETIGFA